MQAVVAVVQRMAGRRASKGLRERRGSIPQSISQPASEVPLAASRNLIVGRQIPMSFVPQPFDSTSPRSSLCYLISATSPPSSPSGQLVSLVSTAAFLPEQREGLSCASLEREASTAARRRVHTWQARLATNIECLFPSCGPGTMPFEAMSPFQVSCLAHLSSPKISLEDKNAVSITDYGLLIMVTPQPWQGVSPKQRYVAQ